MIPSFGCEMVLVLYSTYAAHAADNRRLHCRIIFTTRPATSSRKDPRPRGGLVSRAGALSVIALHNTVFIALSKMCDSFTGSTRSYDLVFAPGLSSILLDFASRVNLRLQRLLTCFLVMHHMILRPVVQQSKDNVAVIPKPTFLAHCIFR